MRTKPGPKPKHENDLRSVRLQVTLTPREAAKVERLRGERSVSDYLRDLVREDTTRRAERRAAGRVMAREAEQ